MRKKCNTFRFEQIEHVSNTFRFELNHISFWRLYLILSEGSIPGGSRGWKSAIKTGFTPKALFQPLLPPGPSRCAYRSKRWTLLHVLTPFSLLPVHPLDLPAHFPLRGPLPRTRKAPSVLRHAMSRLRAPGRADPCSDSYFCPVLAPKQANPCSDSIFPPSAHQNGPPGARR